MIETTKQEKNDFIKCLDYILIWYKNIISPVDIIHFCYQMKKVKWGLHYMVLNCDKYCTEDTNIANNLDIDRWFYYRMIYVTNIKSVSVRSNVANILFN